MDERTKINNYHIYFEAAKVVDDLDGLAFSGGSASILGPPHNIIENADLQPNHGSLGMRVVRMGRLIVQDSRRQGFPGKVLQHVGVETGLDDPTTYFVAFATHCKHHLYNRHAHKMSHFRELICPIVSWLLIRIDYTI